MAGRRALKAGDDATERPNHPDPPLF